VADLDQVADRSSCGPLETGEAEDRRTKAEITPNELKAIDESTNRRIDER
jgi:hypothetical protein